MKTKLISAMKWTKDRMDNMLPIADTNKLLDAYKLMGATHVDVSTVMSHPNFTQYTKLWLEATHAKGMFVTLRCAHKNMEGLYGADKYVGGNRKPQQFWIDEAVNQIKSLDQTVKPGDEIAIYPERTEGIFQDATAFLDPVILPTGYGGFFVNLHEAIKAVVPAGVVVGLSANNWSEYNSGWMPKIFSDKYNVVVIDHYVDGDPDKFDAQVRLVFQKYGKQVYVQEGAPSRFVVPTRAQADAYYAKIKKLDDDGVLYGFGSWSGWFGNPESTINADYTLNDNGKSLQALFTGTVTPPTQPPTEPPASQPVDLKPVLDAIADLKKEVVDLKAAIDSRETLEQVEATAWGPGTLSARMKIIKSLVPNE